MNQPISSPSNSSVYTFGDNPTAARRLELLARAFSPPTVAFLRQFARGAQTCLDLGCGPGFTTRLVHEVVGAKVTVGLDRSKQMVARARAALAPYPGISARPFDLEHPDTSVRPAEVVFARFLLTHLAEPDRALEAAASLLLPGGRLLVQETAALKSEDACFRRYYDLVAQLQAHHGQTLTIGQSLAEVAPSSGGEVIHCQKRSTAQPAEVMAELHAMNITTWSQDAFAREHFDPHELLELHDALRATVDGRRLAPPVELELGELVFERWA